MLLNVGLHVPVIPFKEVVGKAANAAPEQIAVTGLNVGVIVAPIVVTVSMTELEHPIVSFTVMV